jgi:metal-responsive CopG/Arc/MetJ family transcriptional regulator
MRSVEQLKTKQVGLKLPVYLLDDLEEITEESSVSRSTIITEAVRFYLEEYQKRKVHQGLKEALTGVKLVQEGKLPRNTLEDLIDELNDDSNK